MRFKRLARLSSKPSGKWYLASRVPAWNWARNGRFCVIWPPAGLDFHSGCVKMTPHRPSWFRRRTPGRKRSRGDSALRRSWRGLRRDITPTRTAVIYGIAEAFTTSLYLLPGLTAGMAARSGGSLSGSNVCTSREIRLTVGTSNLTAPPDRSTATATPTTWPPRALTMSTVS